MKFDYIIVGGGVYGLVFSYLASCDGKRVMIIEKRSKLGGNIIDEDWMGISVHKYGAHIFHTSDDDVWEFVNRFTKFNNFINRPISIVDGEVYNLPFNMNTFCRLWPKEVCRPEDARVIIDRECKDYKIFLCGKEPTNLEEQACSMCGDTIYRKLIRDYTEKQWGRECKDLPPEIIKRIPLRFTYDNNYFNDKYQGIPIGGYRELINKLSQDACVVFGADYNLQRSVYRKMGNKVIYTGPIDAYFDYCLGRLEWRGCRFETELIEGCSNYQGNAVVNHPERDKAYTRTIEHKHFSCLTEEDINRTDYTILTKEYPIEAGVNTEPFYPITNTVNMELYKKYKELAEKEEDVYFRGRLGEYKYYDMDKIIRKAMDDYAKER